VVDKVNGKMYSHLEEKSQWTEKWREWCTQPFTIYLVMFTASEATVKTG